MYKVWAITLFCQTFINSFLWLKIKLNILFLVLLFDIYTQLCYCMLEELENQILQHGTTSGIEFGKKFITDLLALS